MRFINRVGGVYNDSGNIALSAGAVYLRLQRNGDDFTAWYSQRGNEWVQVGVVSFPAAHTLQVGVHLINEWQDNPAQADFEHFEFDWCARLPVHKIYLPLVVR